jgi:DNA-binding NarL/FixJ family response regulator
MVRILIFEPTSNWTALLERSFLSQTDRQCRWQPFFPDFLAEIRAGNADVALVVTTADDAGLAELANLREAAPPTLRIVCLTAGDNPQWEWGARELGADVVLPDVSEAQSLVRAVDRLIQSLVR